MDNTQDNKQQFFAQYYRQKVIVFNEQNINTRDKLTPQLVDIVTLSWPLIKYGVLELTPLSSITDEHAIQACEVAYNLSFTYGAKWTTKRDREIGFITIKSKSSHHSFDLDFNSGIVEQYQDEFNRTENIMDHYAVCDYLRSKGYALSFMGLSVDQLVEYGWVSLTP